jgi:hypothetical protein
MKFTDLEIKDMDAENKADRAANPEPTQPEA